MVDVDSDREQQLPGGCALGCVAASMMMALLGLATVSLVAFALGVSQSVQAMVVPADGAAVTDQAE